MAPTAELICRDGTVYCTFSDDELLEAVREACSFKLEGAEYRHKHADGKFKLFARGKAPVGLLDRICRVAQLHEADIRVSYADSGQAAKPQIELSLTDVSLRDYQQEALLAAMLNERGIFRVPTGGGKTLLGAAIVASKKTNALVIAPTIDLLRQYREELEAHLRPTQPFQLDYRTGDQAGGPAVRQEPWEIGQLGDGVVNPQPVTVATIRTIAKVLDVAYEQYAFAEVDDSDDTAVQRSAELKAWVESLGVVIGDEIHLAPAKTYYNCMTKIPAPCKYGMSASPWRDDGADLMIEAATGPPIFRVTTERLVAEGHLMAPEIHVYDTSTWWTAAAWGSVCTRCKRQHLEWTARCECGNKNFRSQFTEAYREEIVKNEVRNTRIAKIVQELDRPTLVLVKQVNHGRTLADLIPNAEFISGKDAGGKRKAALDRIRAGELQVLVATVLADLGLDIPNLEALVLAAGGKSSTRHLQRIGRVVRAASDKQRPVVVDFDDSHVHAWFHKHERARRKVEAEEWADLATWYRH